MNEYYPAIHVTVHMLSQFKKSSEENEGHTFYNDLEDGRIWDWKPKYYREGKWWYSMPEVVQQ